MFIIQEILTRLPLCPLQPLLQVFFKYLTFLSGSEDFN